MTFKIGDKVKLIECEENNFLKHQWGEIFIIQKINGEYIDLNKKIRDCDFGWLSSRFELIKECCACCDWEHCIHK